MKGYHANIEALTLANNNFRQVLYTARYGQLVLMSLRTGEAIDTEVHPANDQFFRIERGHGTITVNTTIYAIKDGDVVIIPAGATHQVLNTSATEDLKMYTLYMPPHHQDGVVRQTKVEAEASAPEFDGRMSE